MRFLDRRIVKHLSKRLGRAESTIKKDISSLGRLYSSTPNARAQIYALKYGTSIRRLLDKEDKASLPKAIELEKPVRVTVETNKKKRKERIIQFVKYPTQDPFRRAHIDEANRAYTYKCYTSVFIICRKIMENLVADILRLKFPENTRENKELYFDFVNTRIKDFSKLLKSLGKKKQDFGMEKGLVERIISCVKPFKKEADSKAHSWYHIVRNKAEIDRMDVQNIFDLFYELEGKLIQQRNLASKATN